MKEQVKLLDSYYKNKRLPNMGVVLNDIKAGDAYRYSYGGYAYDNGYYSENRQNGLDQQSKGQSTQDIYR